MRHSFCLVFLTLATVGLCGAQRFEFQPPVSIPVSYSFQGPYSIAAADLNGDGLPEIVIGQTASTDIPVIPGSGVPLFRPPADCMSWARDRAGGGTEH